MEQVTKLPDFIQPGESCWLIFGHGMVANNAEVLKVHFSKNKIQYDVVAFVDVIDQPAETGYRRIRFYSIDEAYVKRPIEENKIPKEARTALQ